MKNPLYFKFIAIAVIALTSIAIAACKKERDARMITANATVINAGLPEADGCGWLLKLDTVTYSPTDLPEKFKVADAKVAVDYYLLDTRFQCGLLAHLGYKQIEIKNIKNR